jgi:hypothetical protein
MANLILSGRADLWQSIGVIHIVAPEREPQGVPAQTTVERLVDRAVRSGRVQHVGLRRIEHQVAEAAEESSTPSPATVGGSPAGAQTRRLTDENDQQLSDEQ